MKELLFRSKKILFSVSDKLAEEFSSGIAIVTEIVNGLPVFVSSEKSSKYDKEYDEKHYFVIPYLMSETGFSLHTMRCLPDGVPEINSLPKRRVFHFPNEHYAEALKAYMLNTARELAKDHEAQKPSTLEELADDIDSLDKKLTYGMLLVGGIAAIFNPVVGIGIATKALLPGIGGLLNKYGLRPVSEKLTRSQLEKAVKVAEERIEKQFSESNTIKATNPILQELELAIRTTESEHDPLLDPNLASGSIPELDNQRWRELTEKAIYHVYKEIYEDKNKHADASLGPEDIRWFKTMFSTICN